MNRKVVVIALVVIAVAGAVALTRQSSPTPTPQARTPVAQRPAMPPPPHSHPAEADDIPAHYETTPSAGSLAPTLPPEKFKGLTRDAYKAAGEIPQIIAQLPCYCHCDKGFGHKSLQSCFVDDHAAHCAICVEEALAAYKLQKQGLSAPQIRERIIAEYGANS